MMQVIRFSLLCFILFCGFNASTQGLADRILKKAEQRASRKIDRTIDKGLDKVEKGVDETVKGGGKKNEPERGTEKETNSNDETTPIPSSTKSGPTPAHDSESSDDETFSTYAKYDFIPGDHLLFVDDFTSDQLGDFPSKWDTNGAATIAVSSGDSLRWIDLVSGSTYVPLLPKDLPEEYTVEFDVRTQGLNKKVTSTSYLEILLDESTGLIEGKTQALAKIFLTQYVNVGIEIEKVVNGERVFVNEITKDIRNKVMEGFHVSIAVNKKRFRLWMDEEKVLDVPSLVPENRIKRLKFYLKVKHRNPENPHIYLGNFKIAAGGVDLRSKLITEGRLSTTSITFWVNSDQIRPESISTLKEIATILKSTPELRINIVGHTDADGNEAYNLQLSKKRALAVKEALIKEYDIESGRIQTDGKGETAPVVGNDTPEGKAANRRVEFIKL